MKVLFIGHYHEHGGWSDASVGLIKALESIDLDVVCRSIKLTSVNYERPEISHLEQKKLENIDVCIQQILPHHMCGTQKFKKNIGYFFSETENIGHLNWMENLRAMDEVWTSADDCLNELKKNGINSYKIPQAFDLNVYKKQRNRNDNVFKFYTIASTSDRKNIYNLIKIYFATFVFRDNVELVLKISDNKDNQSQLIKSISDMVNSLKDQLRIHKDKYNYPPVRIVSETLSGEGIQELHSSCDCFVNISHGEAWSIPAFEAMCYGNTPICTAWGGPREYIISDNKDTGCLIDYSMSVCEYSNPPFEFVGTGKEWWASPDEKQVSDTMMYYYKNRDNINRDAGILAAEKFSLKNVGLLIKERIEHE